MLMSMGQLLLGCVAERGVEHPFSCGQGGVQSKLTTLVKPGLLRP